MATSRGLANSIWAQPGRTVLPADNRTRKGHRTNNRTTIVNSSPPGTHAAIAAAAARAPVFANVSNAVSTAVSNASQNGSQQRPLPRPGAATARDELSRYQKIVRRLKWKAQFLDAGYRQAIAHAASGRRGADLDESDESELMFKLDFFEYYMLVERALVHLQGVFGIVIDKTKGAVAVDNSNNVGDRMDVNGAESSSSSHAYHHNVLVALDDPANPLHDVLGRGDVRMQLLRAKQLRNRWKNADDEEHNGTCGPVSLEAYNLSKILATVFIGFDAAYVVAERFVADLNTQFGEGRVISWAEDTEMLAEEEAAALLDPSRDQWDFMVDAMDWEAV